MADIASITPATATVEIKHPATGERIGLTIHLLSDEAPPMRDLKRKFDTETLRNRGKLTADKLEHRILERLVTATESWEWGTDDKGDECSFDGEKPECTPVNVRKIYKAKPWLRDQVTEAMADDAEFFRDSD
jgi:hypothetical protein